MTILWLDNVCLDKRGVHLVTLTELSAVVKVSGAPVEGVNVVIVTPIVTDYLQPVCLQILCLCGDTLTHPALSLRDTCTQRF